MIIAPLLLISAPHDLTETIFPVTGIVGFKSIHNSNLYAQYYDLSVGTERHFYNCYGVTSNCDLPLPGEQTVDLERVTDEITVDGVSFPEKQAVVNGGLRDNLIMKAFKGMYRISC